MGDRLIEIAASLGIGSHRDGLYLWWPRKGRSLGRALTPELSARRRPLWKSLHQTIVRGSPSCRGVPAVGPSWAGNLGREVRAGLEHLPAAKWDAVPLSDATHASMNHGGEKRTLPLGAGADADARLRIVGRRPGLPEGEAPTLDGIVAFGRSLGFDVRFQVNLPAGETGVLTLSRDTMSKDSHDPTSDRTIHVDQKNRHIRKILADGKFEDYSLAGKAMAVSIPFHEGDMGWWNVIFNTLFCLS